MTFSPVRKSKRQCAKRKPEFMADYNRTFSNCWSIRSLDVALKAKGVVR